jgi:hypothetical protein
VIGSNVRRSMAPDSRARLSLLEASWVMTRPDGSRPARGRRLPLAGAARRPPRIGGWRRGDVTGSGPAAVVLAGRGLARHTVAPDATHALWLDDPTAVLRVMSRQGTICSTVSTCHRVSQTASTPTRLPGGAARRGRADARRPPPARDGRYRSCRPLVRWPCTMASIAHLAATRLDGTGQATSEGTGAKNLGPRMHTTDSQGI